MDVVLFTVLVTGYLWLIMPLTHGHSLWDPICILALVCFAVVAVRRQKLTRVEMGLVLRNLPQAASLFLGATLLYAGMVLFYYRDVLVHPGVDGNVRLGRLVWRIVWALQQEFCLLSFLLVRLRQIFGQSTLAVVISALIFAFFHLPNPFLAAYALGGGLIAASLFLRWPSLPAAILAHVTASALVGNLLPMSVTAGMRVGPLYFWLK